MHTPVQLINTYGNDDFCTILTNAKQSGNDEDYLHKVDDDTRPHKAEEIKHLPLHNSNLATATTATSNILNIHHSSHSTPNDNIT